jgi:hypothetical protein
VEENLEIVRQFYEELSADVWEASPDLFGPEFALDLTDAHPDLGFISGSRGRRDGVARIHRDVRGFPRRN